jgi:hypothetical protein
MSAMVKTRPRLTNPIKAPEPVEETETGLSRHSLELKSVGSDSEGPEDAIREEEGPESWEEWNTEAPDAGRGEYLSIERDFTHGRSRS